MTHPCIEFARIDTTSPYEVARYMSWLYHGRWPEQEPSDEEATLKPEALLDAFWHWDAPRRRLLKLLWQHLHRSGDETDFHGTFTAAMHWFVEDAADCGELLPPIQDRLRRVLAAVDAAQAFSSEAGQLDWGEELFLPAAEAAIVRTQLERVSVSLLEKESNYEEALGYSVSAYRTRVLGYIPPSFSDVDRRYEGAVLARTRAVTVVNEGASALLINADDPTEPPGIGMAWGYAGHGPNVLAISLLTDALDGDVVLASAHARDFRDQFVTEWAMDSPFAITRSEILAWLGARGVDREASEEARRQLDARRGRFEKRGGELLARWEQVRNAGGLVTQRFALVPADFEAGLYVDLMEMLQRGGGVMRCSRCELPIGFDGSSRARRQRGRYREGLPVYHDSCAHEHRLEVKRLDWRRRSADPAFRRERRDAARRSRRE